MQEAELNHQMATALIERIACHSVGIAVNANTGVGTGTLIEFGRMRFVLTAEHVIRNVLAIDMRFWCRPSTGMIEKSAKQATVAEIGRLTAGVHFPIEKITADVQADLALLHLPVAFDLPPPLEFLKLSSPRTFVDWDEEKLNGLSMLYFGFPVDNSRPLSTAGNRTFFFIGTAYQVCEYDRELNSTAWNRLPSKFSAQKDFLLNYDAEDKPYGFSGCGVWIIAMDATNQIWSPDPLLIGVVHDFMPKSSLLVATKLPRIIEACQSAGAELAANAHDEFVKSGIVIRDVYGKLDDAN
jgi:hypothetical protein